MNYLKKLGLVATALVISTGLARADEWDKQTKITINEAIQLPTMTLQPGTYVLTLDRRADPQGQIVRVWDKDQKRQITMVYAEPNRQIKPAGKTELTFWETPAGEPKAVRAWFYPGDDWGQEFKYPKDRAAGIQASNQGSVPTLSENANEKSTESAAVATAEPVRNEPETTAAAPAPVETASAAPAPAPEPVPQDNATQAQAQAAATAPQNAVASDDQPMPAAPASMQPDNTTLPKTASNLPLIAFVGLASLGLFAGTFVLRRALAK